MQDTTSGEATPHAFIKSVHGVRYQVKDVAADLPGFIAELTATGLRFRNEMETGPGGRQIQIEDPGGNPIELFEPAR